MLGLLFSDHFPQELLVNMDTVLRVALVRSHVTAACLTSILQVTASFYRKIESREQALASNKFASTVLELLSEALHIKFRLLPSTLAATVQVSEQMNKGRSIA